jgi:hypothetical protein
METKVEKENTNCDTVLLQVRVLFDSMAGGGET